MANDVLSFFLKTSYFTSGDIIVKSKDGSYVKGRFIDNAETQETITTEKVLVPATAKQIRDLGLGEYGDGEVFSLWLRDALKFNNGTLLQKGDIIEYDGFNYKIEAVLNYKTHGFYKYTIGMIREASLND